MTERNHGKANSQTYESNMQIRSSFLVHHEFLIPLALFLVFLAVALPGISWGAPSFWHPDEIVLRSIKALHGEWNFSETNFDYPDLPQYVMFGLGKVMQALGYRDGDILVTARVLSAVLFGSTIVFTYIIARLAGGSIAVAGLSGLFLLCVGGWAHNAHFAHNDSFLVLFTTLSILMLLQYHAKGHRGWLYASFLTVGMAASSKYIGGSLLLAPLAYYLFHRRRDFRSNLFGILETLFIGAALAFMGYAVGTPKALFWMTWYFKRVLAALQWQIEYGHTPDAVRGVIGQYPVLWNGLGWAIFLLFGSALLWACLQVVLAYQQKTFDKDERPGNFSILLLALLALDLPMLVSYNYQFRYFLALFPILAVFSGFFVEWFYARASQVSRPIYSQAVIAGVVLVVLFSFARLASISLLFMNDARAPAGEFIKTLPKGTSLEHTYYPPRIPKGHFEREHNYPVHFIRNINDKIPVSKKYDFNVGEVGLDDRRTTYLVTDSFTADRFDDTYTCSLMPAECDFFKALSAGISSHYRLLADFSYHLPAFLPQIRVEYVNPAIRIYERIE